MLIYPVPRLQKKPGTHWIPLGLSYIASSLQAEGHQVIIFDRYATAGRIGPEKDGINRAMMKKLREFKPDLIGLNAVTPLIADTIECIKLIRREFEGLLLAGGHHVTALPELTLQRIPELNGVIQGEGERVLPRVANGENPLSIPGVWWRNDGEVTGSPPEQIVELDALPIPDYDLLDMPFYLQPGRHAIRGQQLRVASIITARGCTQKCDFCTESMTYGSGVRMHSAEYVLRWIEHLVAKYPVEGLYFLDNDFLIDRERAVDICNNIIDSGFNRRLRFAVQTRVTRLDPELLRILKQAGCTLLEMGIEATAQEQLNAVHKGTTVELNRKALEMCREAGIPAHAYMIMGFPGETVEDLDQRLKWLQEVGSNFTVSLSMLKIYPGTRLYEKHGGAFFEKNEWSEENIDRYYRKDHLSSVSPEQRAKWMKEKYALQLRRRNRLTLIKNNNLLELIRIVLEKIGERIKRSAKRG
jgi:radical SAM superfamily enzyme YgiQ (UPF0313 family)